MNIEESFVFFYNVLVEQNILTILNFKSDFFSTIMERALHRKKPFNDEKTEFKDCTTWLTYADFVEHNNLYPCYLLTNNIKDFFNKEPVLSDPFEYPIHNDLRLDSQRFRCFPSIKDFFKIVIEPQIQASQRFQNWFKNINIDEAYIFDLLIESEADKIESAITREIENWEVGSEFSANDWSFTGYCQATQVELDRCSSFEIDVLEDACIINAVLKLQVGVEGWAYNPVHDGSDDKYSYIGEKDYQAEVSVSFTLTEDDVYDAFDIDDIIFTIF